MTASHLALWLALMLLGFCGSALFSAMETGAYTLNRVRLHLLEHRGKRWARGLRRLVEQPTVLLTTLLAGNNIANYLGAASLGVILKDLGLGDWQTIILNTLLVTPVLFIFCETLPKDLFAAHADKLMYPLAPVLVFFRWLFTLTGLTPLIGLISAGIMRAAGKSGAPPSLHPRRRIEALVKEGVGYGLLSDEQSAIVERVLALAGREVRDEMVPWRDVTTVRISDPPAKLWELADRTSRSRFPVLADQGHVMGVLDITDVLKHAPDRCPSIQDMMDPAFALRANEPLRTALHRLQTQRVALAVVIDGRGRPVGVATVKDLVEPITGELSSW